MITTEQLAEIKDYCAKATAGPWETMYNIGCRGTHLSGLQEECYVGCDNNEFPDDMRFIAHARTDLPLLVAEVERLKEGLETGQGIHNAACWDLMRTRDDLSAAQKRISELSDALQGLFAMVEAGTLVRNTEHDHDPKWYMTALELTSALSKAKTALTTPP